MNNKEQKLIKFPTIKDAVDSYIEKFGGYPAFSLRGIPDEIIIKKIETALEMEEEISIEFEDDIDL